MALQGYTEIHLGVCNACLSQGAMRLWAAHLALGTEVKGAEESPLEESEMAQYAIQVQSPTTGAIFRQPCEAQRTAEGLLSSRTAEQFRAAFEPISWKAFAGLCARKVSNSHWDHESTLVHMVEFLDGASQENTLSSWILERACDATTMADDSPETWFRILRAAEDVALSTQKTKTPRQIHFLCANVSSWRAERRQWLVESGPEVALTQEVRWTADALAKEKIALAKLGYELHAQPSPTRKNSVGGIAVMTKAHLKGTFHPPFSGPDLRLWL